MKNKKERKKEREDDAASHHAEIYMHDRESALALINERSPCMGDTTRARRTIPILISAVANQPRFPCFYGNKSSHWHHASKWSEQET